MNARRGKRRGGTDSLMRRLTIAITASLTGSNVSRIASANQAPVSATAWRVTKTSVNAAVPNIMVATYNGSARRRHRVQSGNSDVRTPSARHSDLRPGPPSQKAGDSASARCASPFCIDCIDASSVCAMASSLCPLRFASRSIARNVSSCVSSLSARKASDRHIWCINKLTRAISARHAISPNRRSEVMVLLRLRFASACSACC